MAATTRNPAIVPGLHVAPTAEDLKQSSLAYNLLPGDDDQPDVAQFHLQELAALLKRFNVQDRFGMHLIHGHSQLDEDSVMLGTTLTSVRGCWTKPARTTDINLEDIHGHIFKLTSSGNMQAYEYHEGPIMGMNDVDPGFFHELIEYLKVNSLTNILGLQVLGKEVPDMMCEFVLKDNGTVMLDSRDVKSWSPFRVTGFVVKHPGTTALQGGESHAKTKKGTHQVFVGGKIGNEDPLIDVLRAEGIIH